MRRIAVVAVSLVAVAALLDPVESQAAVRCGEIAEVQRAAVVVERGSVSCRMARRVLGRYLKYRRPCDAAACAYMVGRWGCSAATAGDFPRLGSCWRGHGRKLIAAYARAE